MFGPSGGVWSVLSGWCVCRIDGTINDTPQVLFLADGKQGLVDPHPGAHHQGITYYRASLPLSLPALNTVCPLQRGQHTSVRVIVLNLLNYAHLEVLPGCAFLEVLDLHQVLMNGLLLVHGVKDHLSTEKQNILLQRRPSFLNHWLLERLVNIPFGLTIKRASKLHTTGPWWRKSTSDPWFLYHRWIP